MICKLTVHTKFPIFLKSKFPTKRKSLVQSKFESLPFGRNFAVKGMGNLILTCQLANYRKPLANYRKLYYHRNNIYWPRESGSYHR